MVLVEFIYYVFVAAAAVEIFYCLFFFVRLAVYRNKTSRSIPLTPVSVIICAKDEQENLKKNLAAVLEQNYPDFEVIVINDNSTDDTTNVLFDFSFKFKNLVVRNLQQESRVMMGKKYALTIGLKAAKNDIVLLTDADCRPSSEYWIRDMRLKFEENKEVVLGYAPYEKTPGFLNRCIRYETFWTALNYLTFAMAGIPYMGVGRNMAYKRKLFFNQNVFVKNPDLLSGDDDLLINEIARGRNTKVQISESSFMKSTPKKLWDEWIHQKRRHMGTGIHYKMAHQILLGLNSIAQFIVYLALLLLLIYSNMQIEILCIFGMRYMIKALIIFGAMRRLKETDLFLFFPLFDLLLPIYQLFMIPSLFKNNNNSWK